MGCFFLNEPSLIQTCFVARNRTKDVSVAFSHRGQPGYLGVSIKQTSH